MDQDDYRPGRPLTNSLIPILCDAGYKVEYNKTPYLMHDNLQISKECTLGTFVCHVIVNEITGEIWCSVIEHNSNIADPESIPRLLAGMGAELDKVIAEAFRGEEKSKD